MRLKGREGLISAQPIGEVNYELNSAYGQAIGNYAKFARDGLTVWLCWNGIVEKYALAEGISDEAGKEALAPMTGKVVAIPVEVGQTVKEGDTLAILEAMKMEYRLEAEGDGEVAEIGAQVGELVDLGHVLVRLK